jgi:EAL domain-containing protein (putative c-di-GMP-specific phosphodiesterase class I)/FixJ family two-component response regulator
MATAEHTRDAAGQPSAKPRILLVDDEPALLAGLRRQLRPHYDVVCSVDPAAALDILTGQGPFAVVVSDMRMPVMDGAAFLEHVRTLAPDATRVLLTGQADVPASIAAINRGQVFRFLCKPCPAEELLDTLNAAVDEHRRVRQQQALLDRSMRVVAPEPASDAQFAELHQALETGQLRVWYQPIVSMETRRIVGAEALIRWQHPERGMIQPDDFIPLAEQTGLIVPIGRWVLQRAGADAAGWRQLPDTEPNFFVAVNVSPHQLADPRLADIVRTVLSTSGLPPNALKLEITESALLEDRETVIHTLQELRAVGVSIAVDDFGTGYSALAYLQQLPLDVLKLDRSFVSTLGAMDNSAVAETIVHLGHLLSLTVVAEGIETESQWEVCRDLGCGMGQGFLFAKPMAAGALTSMLGEPVPEDYSG